MTTPRSTPDSSYSRAMRPLRYSINITVDGCVDHTAVTPTEAMHRHSADLLAAADALLFGRVIYEMMDAGWREVARNDELLDGRPETLVKTATLATVAGSDSIALPTDFYRLRLVEVAVGT